MDMVLLAGKKRSEVTTVTAPTVWMLPTPRDIWRLVKVDTSVAKFAIVCATILGVAIVGGIIAVAVLGGDVAALSLAVGGIVSTAIGAWFKLKSGGNSNGG